MLLGVDYLGNKAVRRLVKYPNDLKDEIIIATGRKIDEERDNIV